MQITITAMSIDGHTVPVPHGLSELLNRAGAWSAAPIPPLDGYRREVKRVDGRLVTELIYVGGGLTCS
jgi:hypothetical protein